MTTTKNSRCVHCGTFYWYHPSGWDGPYNHPEYCPDCQEAVEKALKKVSVRFIKKWVPTDDYSREQLQTHLDERSDYGRQTVMRRIMPGLYDQNRKIWQESVCEMIPDPTRPHISFWYLCQWFPGEEATAKVMKQVWWDIQKKVVSPEQWDRDSGPLYPMRIVPTLPEGALP
jgi:hypothetical protein